jgi:hypothetical protein
LGKHAVANAAEGAVEGVSQMAVSGAPITPAGLVSTAASSAAVSTAAGGALSKVDLPTPRLADILPTPMTGQTIYRVYGDGVLPGGASWSPVDPGSVSNYRDAAGLPSGGVESGGALNSGRFVIEGTLMQPSSVVVVRSALPLDGHPGGTAEYIIPNGIDSGVIRVYGVSGVNAEF